MCYYNTTISPGVCNAQRNEHKKLKKKSASQTLQASISKLNFEVHDSAVRKRLKCGFLDKLPGQSLFSLRKKKKDCKSKALLPSFI